MELLHSQKMELFSQMISCGKNVSYWELDPGMQLISTTCREAELFHHYLLADPSSADLQRSLRCAQAKPLIFTGILNLLWAVSPEIVDGTLCRVHMIGPVFTSDVSVSAIQAELNRRPRPKGLTEHFMEALRQVPTMPMPTWLNYGLMLHYCVTGIKSEIYDYLYIGRSYLFESDPETPTPSIGTWYAEQVALKMVEEGQVDYKKALAELGSVGGSVSAMDASSLPRSKLYVASFIALVSRAAIRGGLEPQSAYRIGERYVSTVEHVSSAAELAQLNATMYDDFVQRVHKIRSGGELSSAIQSCCSYIDLHLGEKLSMKVLADQVGYADYYLAQKFKKEMGMTVAQYIKKARVERAKLLLRSSNQSVASIADSLGFCNTSYFSEAFRSLTGMTPLEYRDRGR